MNRPVFLSLIEIHKNTTTNKTVHGIDARVSKDVEYLNKTLTFRTPENLKWENNTEYYITFSEGVLYSDNLSNSSAQTDTEFWSLIAITNETFSFTSKPISSTTTTEPSVTLPKGEPSPTHSARLGMGLGISLILIIIIGELIYFNYCYYGNTLRGSSIA